MFSNCGVYVHFHGQSQVLFSFLPEGSYVISMWPPGMIQDSYNGMTASGMFRGVNVHYHTLQLERRYADGKAVALERELEREPGRGRPTDDRALFDAGAGRKRMTTSGSAARFEFCGRRFALTKAVNLQRPPGPTGI